jgi:hypothetical protein
MTTYVPILKSKQAEFWACGKASKAVIKNSRVVFEIVPTDDVNNTISNFATKLSRNWPHQSSVTVDSSHVNRPNGIVLQVAQALQAKNIKERPVFRLDDSAQVLTDIRATCAIHTQGACLRLGSETQDPDPNIPNSKIVAILKKIDLESSDIDLLIDFSVIGNQRDVTRCIPLAILMLNWASNTGPWRSVTIASGACPQSVSNLPLGNTTPLARYDAVFYTQVLSKNPVIIPDFGDYGISYPFIQPPIPRSPKPYIKYTNAQLWQVHREDNILPGNQSFFTVCERIVQSQYWAGINYSAGDTEIERCSRHSGGAGAATQWIAFGTSHHMAHVVDRLATLGAP